jgi:hypothetical protein
VRWLVSGPGLLLLVSAFPACLLYTDRINTPPEVVIERPEQVHPGETARFKARLSDRDGDEVSVAWLRVDKGCNQTTPADWQGARRWEGNPLDMVPTHAPFCLKLVARDSEGAETIVDAIEGKPVNRPPEVTVGVVEPTTSDRYPLFTTFRLRANAVDRDNDTLSYGWQVHDEGGEAVPLVGCPTAAQPEVAACFTALRPGRYTATAQADDGFEPGRGMVVLMVDPDQPPCIDVTDPTVETPAVVLAVTDPPRRFEVRRVRDDGHPFPPTPPRGTSFRWYTARETGPWTRALGYDGATFDVGATRFEDARPGSIYRVRVEARDPAHDEPATLLDIEDCADQRVCERPAHCVRWVGWKVELR